MSAVNPEGDGRVGVSQKLKPVFVILKEIQKKKNLDKPNLDKPNFAW